MQSNGDHVKEVSAFEFILLLCLFFAILSIPMNIFGFRYIAKYMAKNESYVHETCAYYKGVHKTKYSKDYYISVDGYVTTTLGFNIKDFPFNSKKKKDFYANLTDPKESACQRIKYVEIDLILTKKIFIYDYLGSKP